MNFDTEYMQQQFADAPVQTLELDQLITEAGTQFRSKMSEEAVENYASIMSKAQSTDSFPALKAIQVNHDVTLEDGTSLEKDALILVDGFHRYQAAREAGLHTFDVLVAHGSYDEAVYFSMGANSTNGVSLVGKDFQKAIKKLYVMDSYWREHGRKREMAQLFGCSTKTVQRAVSLIDKDTKAKAFKMFVQGAEDSYIAEFAHKDEVTIQRWREEWEESKVEPEETPKEAPQEDPNDPLNLTVKQLLSMNNLKMQESILHMLEDAIKTARLTEGIQEEPEGSNEDMQALAKEWKGKTCWEILGKPYEVILEAKNPRGALKRANAAQLRKCHSDTYGDNPALELLKSAYAEASNYFKN